MNKTFTGGLSEDVKIEWKSMMSRGERSAGRDVVGGGTMYKTVHTSRVFSVFSFVQGHM